jgi:hypothetical protein
LLPSSPRVPLPSLGVRRSSLVVSFWSVGPPPPPSGDTQPRGGVSITSWGAAFFLHRVTQPLGHPSGHEGMAPPPPPRGYPALGGLPAPPWEFPAPGASNRAQGHGTFPPPRGYPALGGNFLLITGGIQPLPTGIPARGTHLCVRGHDLPPMAAFLHWLAPPALGPPFSPPPQPSACALPPCSHAAPCSLPARSAVPHAQTAPLARPHWPPATLPHLRHCPAGPHKTHREPMHSQVCPLGPWTPPLVFASASSTKLQA